MSANRWNEQSKATAKTVAADAPNEAQPVSPVAPEVKSYAMAKGCQLVTNRGTLYPGENVYVSDLSDGQPHLEQLVSSGFVVEQRQ